jgi:hypothetical protein
MKVIEELTTFAVDCRRCGMPGTADKVDAIVRHLMGEATVSAAREAAYIAVLGRVTATLRQAEETRDAAHRENSRLKGELDARVPAPINDIAKLRQFVSGTASGDTPFDRVLRNVDVWLDGLRLPR